MAVERIRFGATTAGEADIFALTNEAGMRAEFTNIGACLVRLLVPDAHDKLVDVVLGFDDPENYLNNPADLGAMVGRNANRIGGSSFKIEGKLYQLTANEGPNNLHSGPDFWFQRMWEAIPLLEENAVEFRLLSPDGDQGFPGELDARVRYTLTQDNKLEVAYTMLPSAQTLINPTQHSYFNLNGHDSGTIEKHLLTLECDYYTPTDSELIPTGELASVEGAIDFRTPKAIATDFGSSEAAIDTLDGYDHNFCVRGEGMRKAATLTGDISGISMEVYTDLPGIQLYTSNGLADDRGKDEASYGKHQAACLETQFFPDAIHKPEWAQPVFGPDKPYQSTTVFAFTTTS